MKHTYADPYALKTAVEGGATVDVEWEMGVFDIDYNHPNHGTQTLSTGSSDIGSTVPVVPPTPSGVTVSAISTPSTPSQTALSGGSILILNSDTDPGTIPTTPSSTQTPIPL